MVRAAVVVRNLPGLTTTDDVVTFFNTRIQGAQAYAFPLVRDTQNFSGNSLCTTVELAQGTKSKALSFNNHDFFPKAAGSGRSRIQIDASFIGPITLAEHNNPQFDLYFVHGVGGNAVSSWVSEATGHMWPRDSFPEQCHNMGIRGRFSTLGYDAKVIDKGEPKTIQNAAESILSFIRADRPQGCERPIFFVCHSLGGLVVTQALVLALAKPAIKPEYAFIQHMIKGVAYFGTPFQGSKNADFLSPLATIVAGITRANTSFVNDLKTFSRDLPTLMGHFNQIRTEEGIELLLFVEKQKDGVSKVTTRTSATLPFRPDIAPIEIDADHRGMVKFPSAVEARHPITEIVNMIKSKLGIQTASNPPNPRSGNRKSVLSVPGLAENVTHTDKNEGFSQLAKFDTVFVIDDTGSMQKPSKSTDTDSETRWEVLTRSLQYIADVAAKYDKDGVDINFLISDNLNETNIKSGQEVLDLLHQVDLTEGGGGTYFEPVLADILGPYVSTYQDYFEKKKRHERAIRPKPLNIIVLTDGQDDEEEATEALLVKIAGQLDKMNAPQSQVGIQFLQVGDDLDAAEYLDRLDNYLKEKYQVRDFVDTKTFKDLEESQADFTENLRRILLGAVNSKLD